MAVHADDIVGAEIGKTCKKIHAAVATKSQKSRRVNAVHGVRDQVQTQFKNAGIFPESDRREHVSTTPGLNSARE